MHARNAPTVLALALVGLGWALAPSPATAQTDARLALGVSVGHALLRVPGELSSLGGILYGVEGSASLWRLRLGSEYRQGWLDPEGDGPDRMVTTARAALGVRVLPGVRIEGGPRISKVRLPDDDRVVVRWRVGIVGHAPLVSDLVHGYLAADGTFAGTDISGVELPHDGGGGEIGLLVQPTGSLWARLGYRYDNEHLRVGSSRTQESAFITVGVSMPRSDSERP